MADWNFIYIRFPISFKKLNLEEQGAKLKSQKPSDFPRKCDKQLHLSGKFPPSPEVSTGSGSGSDTENGSC